MATPWMSRLFLANALAATALMAGCSNASMDSDAEAERAKPEPHFAGRGLNAASPEDAEQQLVGNWLREHTEQGIHSRRILRLDADGSFEENVRLTDAAGTVSDHHHAGTWLYDGTNLKRKYTLMNGQPPSRLNLPFATFEVQLPSRNELVGTDHIHRHRVQYRRVGPETEL